MQRWGVGTADGKLIRTAQDEIRAPRAAGVAGIVFALLFAVSLWLTSSFPSWQSSAMDTVAWYLDSDARILSIVSIYLMPFAGIAFLWFMAVIRDQLGQLEDRFMGTVFLGSGVLFVAMIFAASASIGSALAVMRFQNAPPPGEDVIYLSRALGYAFVFIYALRAGAVFMLVMSSIARSTQLLPRWVVVLGYLVAVLLLVGSTQYDLMVMLFPAWVALLSIIILARGGSDEQGQSHSPTTDGL